MDNIKTIVYIAGYGRSGSTLLDIMLGNTVAFQNTGELNTVFDECLSGNPCSCGLSYDSCEVWKSYFAAIKKLDTIKNIKNTVRKIDKRETVFNPWDKQLSQHEKKLYKRIHDLLFEVLDTAVIVDSSKTAAYASFRPLALKEICGYDVKVIHLQRGFLGVMRSLAKGSNNTMQNQDSIRPSLWTQLGFTAKNEEKKKRYSKVPNFLRGILGYYLANRDAKKLKYRMGTANYIHLRFEDLIHDPVKTLTSIEQQFGLSLKESRKKITYNMNLNTGHIAGGNRMAKKPTIKLENNE